jgi:hypothetical protein
MSQVLEACSPCLWQVASGTYGMAYSYSKPAYWHMPTEVLGVCRISFLVVAHLLSTVGPYIKAKCIRSGQMCSLNSYENLRHETRETNSPLNSYEDLRHETRETNSLTVLSRGTYGILQYTVCFNFTGKL